MNPVIRSCSRFLAIVLLVCGFTISSTAPLLASPQSSQFQSDQARASQSTSQVNTGQISTNQSGTNQEATDVPGDAGQKTAVPLPEAPQAQDDQTQQQTNPPSGAAGAKAAPVKGAPVAQPAGAAIAPVRQRGHRSLLIKLGLIAGAGIAIGAAVALSERSPSRPPGATTAAAQ
jgi:hypothetical protein